MLPSIEHQMDSASGDDDKHSDDKRAESIMGAQCLVCLYCCGLHLARTNDFRFAHLYPGALYKMTPEELDRLESALA